jgi:hypothetical protein
VDMVTSLVRRNLAGWLDDDELDSEIGVEQWRQSAS